MSRNRNSSLRAAPVEDTGRAGPGLGGAARRRQLPRREVAARFRRSRPTGDPARSPTATASTWPWNDEAPVATLASDPGVVDALADLQPAYEQLDGELTTEQIGELEAEYADVVRPFDDAGVDRPEVATLVPDSVAGRSLQYRYIVDNPESDRADLVDASDGTAYSGAHAEHHRFLRGLASSIGATDLLLIGAESNHVVYSVQKRIDLGTDVEPVPTGTRVSVRPGIDWAGLRHRCRHRRHLVLPADASAPIAHVAATCGRTRK